MKKLIFFWLLFIVWSCKHKSIEIKIDNITSNKIEYTIHNYSNENISILIPKNDFFCYEYDSLINNYKLIVFIYNSHKEIMPVNLDLYISETVEHLELTNKLSQVYKIDLKSKSIFNNSKYIPISETECFRFYSLINNEKYFIQLILTNNKNDTIKSDLYKFNYK